MIHKNKNVNDEKYDEKSDIIHSRVSVDIHHQKQKQMKSASILNTDHVQTRHRNVSSGGKYFHSKQKQIRSSFVNQKRKKFGLKKSVFFMCIFLAIFAQLLFMYLVLFTGNDVYEGVLEGGHVEDIGSILDDMPHHLKQEIFGKNRLEFRNIGKQQKIF